ncbi:MAG: VWA domain-containing protein [Verrucomicrobiaceae bacterium]
MKDCLTELLNEFEGLAGLVSCQNGLSVVVGKSHDCSWSFNWKTGQITVNPADLAIRPRDFLLGLVVHEAGHAALTRFQHIVPRTLLSDMAVHLLLNSIEDCRIESALVERLPGCESWVKIYNDTLFEDMLQMEASKMHGDQGGAFLAAILCRWWYGRYPVNIPSLARTTLDEIWQHIERAIASRPPAQCLNPRETTQRYERHPVHVCYRGLDHGDEPSPMELEVRMSQYEMWEIVWRKILPAFQTLLEKAQSPLGAVARFLQEQKIRIVTVGDQDASTKEDSLEPTEVGVERDRFNRLAAFSIQSLSRLNIAGREYHEARLRYHAAIEKITHELLETLTAVARPRHHRFYSTGRQLDMRQAMQYEADPGLYDTLWMRQNVPSKPDPAFVVLADGSHSMQGERALATFNVLVMLRESCLRIGIPLTIIVFDSGARVAQNWSEPTSNAVIPILCSLRNEPCGHTNMAQGLMLACRHVVKMPSRDRHLWLLSDGDPDEPGDAKRLIEHARKYFRTMTALGLGPETEGLKKLIPHSITNLSADQLPALAGRIFKKMACSAA